MNSKVKKINIKIKIKIKLAAAAAVVAALCAQVQLGIGADISEISIASDAHRTPLVELYTSEGCNSCPPADDWLSRLGQVLDSADDDKFSAVPLAFHVDYWNYLGWTDPFSKPQYSQRQRRAPANRLRGGVYTPEFIADGRESRGGQAVLRAIKNANAQAADARIELRLTHQSDKLRAHIDIETQAADAQLFLAIYERDITRKIGGGENHGRTLLYDFVVRHWSAPIAVMRGESQNDFTLDIPPDWNRANLGAAAVVLSRKTGATVQAVRTPLAALFSG